MPLEIHPHFVCLCFASYSRYLPFRLSALFPLFFPCAPFHVDRCDVLTRSNTNNKQQPATRRRTTSRLIVVCMHRQYFDMEIIFVPNSISFLPAQILPFVIGLFFFFSFQAIICGSLFIGPNAERFHWALQMKESPMSNKKLSASITDQIDSDQMEITVYGLTVVKEAYTEVGTEWCVIKPACGTSWWACVTQHDTQSESKWFRKRPSNTQNISFTWNTVSVPPNDFVIFIYLDARLAPYGR